MKLQFLGASQTVTGSRYLVSEGNERVLIDCGLFQGLKDLRLKNWLPFPIEPSTIQAVILTHAHLDHSGYIPLLIKNGFTGPIYCTEATRDLSKILLLDSGYLQEEEARIANKKGYSKHSPALPLYTKEDAEAAMKNFAPVPLHKRVQATPNIMFELKQAGHILGASSIYIKSGKKTILFSGDLGRSNDPLTTAPESPGKADYLVVESTYGDRVHPKVNPMLELRTLIMRTLDRGGIVLIPSFAVGRAQLILYFLRELKKMNLIPDIPIFLNSPMAKSVNEVFIRHAGQQLGQAVVKEICDVAQVVSSVEESVALNQDRAPKIIIAASGMASGGRVLHHLKRIAPDPKNTVVFVGFQAAGTRGEALVNGVDEIKIHGEFWPVKAEIVNLESLSAHADSDEILKWIGKMPDRPKKIFVTHGEHVAAETLKRRILSELEIDAVVPEVMSAVDL